MRLGPYEVEAAQEFGPRITSLRRESGPQFLARLDDAVTLPHSAGTVYRLRGGHRLWAAPEIPSITYAPDDHGCVVTEDTEALSITAPPDVVGLAKELHVSLEEEQLRVDHRLINTSNRSLEIGSWAITQVRLGGEATLPIPASNEGLQADRSLVLWPYTRLDDERIEMHSDHVRIRGLTGPPLKLGSGPDAGWLEYRLDGWCFRKRAVGSTEGVYADRGAICQVYVKDAFLELETLGPIIRLGPGESLDHREMWEIVP